MTSTQKKRSYNLPLKTLETLIFEPKMTINPSPAAAAAANRWPGWPGDNVFRMIVPAAKVGGIIGRGGEIVKKLCDETGARIRIFDGPLRALESVVLISGKEKLEAEVSPAMDAVLRVFKRLNCISRDGKNTSESGICSVRLLLIFPQDIDLIGKQGSLIKSIQEESGAVIHVLNGDEQAYYASANERIADIRGETLNVLKALETVLGHLRKFLVDHSVIPVFEKRLNEQANQDHIPDSWTDQNQSLIRSSQQIEIVNDYYYSLKRDSSILDMETQHDSLVPHRTLSPYRLDPALSELRFPRLGQPAGGLVTQIAQIMQIPLRYAEDIIGIGGVKIAYVRRRSGAALSVLETTKFDEMVVEIKGTPTQVQTAQQLIEDRIAWHEEQAPSSHAIYNARSTPFSQLRNLTFDGYGSPELGDFKRYRFN